MTIARGRRRVSVSLTDSFLGVDYGVRKVAWCLLAPSMPGSAKSGTFEVGELVLPGKRKYLDPCDLCQLSELVEYMHSSVLRRLDDSTVVAIEAPIMGRANDKRTAARLGMVAGALAAAALTRSSKHLLVPPAP